MSKKYLKKKETVATVSNPLPIAETKRIAIETTMSRLKQETILKELSEKDIPDMIESQNLIPSSAVSKKLTDVSLASSLESGHVMVESLPVRYRGFALQLKQDFEEEFTCSTPSEKALVQQMVNSHIRKLSYSKMMEERNAPDWLSHERVAFLNFYSRETDRAHRQFLSALEALKAIKQPSFNVNVKTQNAFIAQNQQNNNHSKQNNESK